ncbi:MAG: glycine oxidase ThiO [Gemmatimonadota bacterium]
MLETVVIGGGIAGCTTALELWRRGAAVNIVEAERPGAGATGASAGMLAPQYESPGAGPLFRLGVEARDHYAAWVRDTEVLTDDSLHLRPGGMLVANLTPEEHADAENAVRWQRAEGQQAELVDRAEAARLQPGVTDDAVSYLWLPSEAQVDTQHMVGVLAAALAATDIRLITGQRVAAVRTQGAAVRGVRLEDGRELAADRVVLAAGAWSNAVDGLPRHIPLRPVRGEMLRFPPGAVDLSRLVTSHAGRYLVPRVDGSVLAGSTMAEVGFDRTVTEEGVRTIHDGVAQLVPALADRRPSERWADVRPLSDDALPILGPDPELDGLVYATGYGRNGILLGPISGSIVADLVLTGESEHDWRPFSIQRFAR